MMRVPKHSGLVCLVALLAALSLADATARLTVSSALHAAVEPEPATPDLDALQHIMQAASSSLQATYTSINPKNPLFPDVVDPETGLWNMDQVNANGAAGLLAGCLWSMFKLTGQDMWRSRALTASAALRSSVDDTSLGQAIGTLAYPAIRYAYESETDDVERALYLDAALQAATTLSTMFAHIPGVLKVRPTSHIAAEVYEAGAAVVSPFAVFSSVEGAAAATGLLTWASQLPGGRASWREIALMNSRKIVTDHMDSTGMIVGTLVYKSTSAREEPRPLSSWASPELRPASSLLSLLEGGGAQGESDADSTARTLESWLSQVAGQESSAELRQALGTMALVEAARAAGKSSDITMFTSALQVTASVLVGQAVDPLAMEPVAAAATACALAELASLDSLPLDDRDEFALAARHVVVTLARHSLGGRGQQATAGERESLAQLAGRWVSSMLSQQPKQQLQQGGRVIPGLTSAKLLLLRGVSHSESSTPSSLSTLLLHSSSAAPPQSPAILTQPDGSGGSMLADHFLLQALTSLTVVY